jgi:crotonobetainyl-CoA:carnitine CoA-transferase CaiB-like acyl-CoA transferase
MFETVETNGAPLKIPAIIPKLSDTPGMTLWPGPELGAHTEEILSGMLEMSAEEINKLREAGDI